MMNTKSETKAATKAAETKAAETKTAEKTPVKATPSEAKKAPAAKTAAEKKAAAPKKAAPAKKEAEPKAVPEKKEAAPKKAVAKKPAAKKEVKSSVVIEYAGRQIVARDVLEAAKKAYESMNKGTAIETIEIYVKPEEGAAYYVVNGEGSDQYKVQL